MSPSGQAYSGTAQTLDISRSGVRLSNAEFLTRVGEVVTLQYQQRRAKYRVMWLGDAEGPERGLAGLQPLPSQPQIWGLDPGTGRPDNYRPSSTSETEAAEVGSAVVPLASEMAVPEEGTASAPAAASERPADRERRSSPRYDCDRGVVCWREGITVPVWGKLRDLSMKGCSVETPVVFEVGTRLKLVLLVFGTKLRVAGEVRSSSGKMMGVLLTTIHREDRSKFQAVLNRLAGPEPATYVPVGNVSDAVLRQIEAWFEERDVLSRDDLQQLLETAKKKS